jgi:hypothetical protein
VLCSLTHIYIGSLTPPWPPHTQTGCGPSWSSVRPRGSCEAPPEDRGHNRKSAAGQDLCSSAPEPCANKGTQGQSCRSTWLSFFPPTAPGWLLCADSSPGGPARSQSRTTSPPATSTLGQCLLGLSPAWPQEKPHPGADLRGQWLSGLPLYLFVSAASPITRWASKVTESPGSAMTGPHGPEHHAGCEEGLPPLWTKGCTRAGWEGGGPP